jgi:S-adenosylmethionine:tRNA ribosyltransferase-isomerase
MTSLKPNLSIRKVLSLAMVSEEARLTATYDYELPRELIAARPAKRRDGSRLLLVDRACKTLKDSSFQHITSVFSSGDAVVINDSRVFPARLLGRKSTGANAEILLVQPIDEISGEVCPNAFASNRLPWLWIAMVRPGGKLKPGHTVEVGDGLSVEILEMVSDGTRVVRLIGDGNPWALIDQFGHTPLPPYIDRPDDDSDRERYQTVYARHLGSVASPTAGLHFTPELLATLDERGVQIVPITLHVGFGTFRPVSVDRVDEHRMPAEAYRLSVRASEQLNKTRAAGKRVWAVGTTSCRVLETAAISGEFESGEGWTDLFLHPPHEFRGVDGLLTNFHLPRSSLLLLVSAFAGRDFVLEAYAHAIAARYRFYSYGDAMVIS